MIDIHCHIMPQVDDGASSYIDSIEMAQLAAASGTRCIVVTPHCNIPNMFGNYWTPELQAIFDRLQLRVSERGIPITFVPGQEIFLASDFVGLLKQGKLISINHSRYLLVELSP